MEKARPQALEAAVAEAHAGSFRFSHPATWNPRGKSFDFEPLGKLETKKLMMPWAEGSQVQCSRCGAVSWHCLLEAGRINGSGKYGFFTDINSTKRI